MKFEFDPSKSKSNKRKHGIDFIEAQVLWDGTTTEIPLLTVDEPRWAVIGMIREVFWTAIITRRGENTTRIISARRSRKEEKEIYEKQK